MPVYLIATLDTKGHEAGFLRDLLAGIGVPVKLVDAGSGEEPQVPPDVPRTELFKAAGYSEDWLSHQTDRGEAVTVAAHGAAAWIRERHAAGEVSGVIGIGGSAGTTIATAAMRALPLGVPKVMVSTLASGAVRPWVGDKDIFMLNSVVDIAGINRVSRTIFEQAARAMAGLITLKTPSNLAQSSDRPLIAATMFGVTTPCVQHARSVLEAAGYEVLVFHATGNGGQAMESLIAEGLLAGVLDLTTTELADELVGGVLSAGPERLTAAAKHGVPQVISVGATDMVNFGPRESIPPKFADRQFHVHNPTVTLMRTTPEESAELGLEIAEKARVSNGPVCIILPLEGVSAIDKTGQPFDDPTARTAMFQSLRENHSSVELIESPHHINDPEFAEAAARKLIELIASSHPKGFGTAS